MLRHNLQSETCVHPRIVFLSDGGRNVVSHLFFFFFFNTICLLLSVVSSFYFYSTSDKGKYAITSLIDLNT